MSALLTMRRRGLAEDGQAEGRGLERRLHPLHALLGADPGEVWIRPGLATVTSRCDGCGFYLHPSELVESRPGGHGKRDLVSTGLCRGCL